MTTHLLRSLYLCIIFSFSAGITLYAQSDSGVALEIKASNGDKGVLLPKVYLNTIDQYLPIQGQEIEGLIVENISNEGK